ncbi:unnamed protein product [Prorocentrum cordatum]|nr:unnamed protein product [Polarella glacialis]
MLSDNEQPQCTNVIAVASPDYPGAYRFEAAYCPGHYLSFDPPKHAQMMRGGDQFAVIDFVLTDFLVSENFKTIDEVLIPAVEALGGGKEGVSLTRVCQNSGVVHHFQKTMGGVIWDFEDFRLHFHAHSDIWDYDPTSQSLRLRGPQEKLAQSLRRARAAAEVASLMSAARQQPAWLPLDAAARALRLLRQGAGAPKAAAGAEALRKAAEAEAKLLRVVCSMCRAGDEHVSLGGLCDAWRALSSGTDGSQADPEAAQLRAEALEAVVKCASEQVVEEQVSFDIPILGALVAMPLDWERCAQVALEKARQVISSEPIARLVPLLREFAGARARKLCDCLATAAIMKVFAAEPAVAIDALDAMVSGGFGLEGAPMVLEMLLGKVPWTASAPVIAGLAEHGAAGDDLDKCWGAVLEPSALETLPGPLLARLALAAAGRRGAGAAGAAGARLQAVALPLAARLRDVPLPLAADVAVCAAGSGPECAGLLEAAVARVAAEGSEPPPADLLRVTQALLPLGDLGTAPRDAAVRCWRRRLEAGAAAAREARAKAQELRVGDAIEVFGLTSETGRPLNGRSGSVTRPIPEKGRFEVRLSLGFSAAETVSLNPKNLRKVRAGTGVAGPTPAELPLGLSADELSRVLAAVAPAAAQSGDGGRALLELLAEEILEQQSGLTAGQQGAVW